MVNNYGKEDVSMYLFSGDDYEITNKSGKKLTILRSNTRQVSTPAGTSSGSTYVKGYYKKYGTYVRGHYRKRRK